MAQVRVRFVLLTWRLDDGSLVMLLLLLPQAPLAALTRKQALLWALSPEKRGIHSQQMHGSATADQILSPGEGRNRGSLEKYLLHIAWL
jgi:hypothetical protein